MRSAHFLLKREKIVHFRFKSYSIDVIARANFEDIFSREKKISTSSICLDECRIEEK